MLLYVFRLTCTYHLSSNDVLLFPFCNIYSTFSTLTEMQLRLLLLSYKLHM
ncbi:hypothetical protein Hanom_Chr05g00423661 [Helianthus anomalus]